jgi:hypothetical protein
MGKQTKRQRRRTQGRRTKSRRTKKPQNKTQRQRGGKMSDQKVRLWVIGYPNHINSEETFSYTDVEESNPSDVFNLGGIDNYMNALVINVPPRAYHKTVAIKRNLAIASTINVGTNQALGYNFAVGTLNNLSVRFTDVVDPSTITAAAFNAVNGTVTNIRPDADNKGAQFDLVFANLPNSQFVMSVAFKAGVVRDLFGNAALAGTAKAWTIDGLPPTAIMTGAARIRLGETANVAIAFSQFVQPLNLSMFVVTFTPLNGATVTVSNSALTLRGAGASWSISHKSAVRGTLTVRLNIDAAGPKDLLGNAMQIPVGYQVVVA